MTWGPGLEEGVTWGLASEELETGIAGSRVEVVSWSCDAVAVDADPCVLEM